MNAPLAKRETRALDGFTNISDFLAFWLRGGVLAPEEQAVFDDYYRSYKKHFGPYLRHHYSRQTQALMESVDSLVRPRVLEVGCGCGTESLWAALHGARVTGIDILPWLLNVAKARLAYLRSLGQDIDCEFIKINLLELEGEERFDIIFLENAFHHLEPRAKVIDKLVELLRPGGRVIFVESNGWNPLAQAAMIKLRGFKTIIEHEGHVWGNERFTVPWALIREFRKRSCSVVSLEYNRILPNWKISDKFLFPNLRISRVFAPVFTHFYLVLKKQAI